MGIVRGTIPQPVPRPVVPVQEGVVVNPDADLKPVVDAAPVVATVATVNTSEEPQIRSVRQFKCSCGKWHDLVCPDTGAAQ
jgi:hypothetical protein